MRERSLFFLPSRYLYLERNCRDTNYAEAWRRGDVEGTREDVSLWKNCVDSEDMEEDT